jgi:hypothetical protein
VQDRSPLPPKYGLWWAGQTESAQCRAPAGAQSRPGRPETGFDRTVRLYLFCLGGGRARRDPEGVSFPGWVHHSDSGLPIPYRCQSAPDSLLGGAFHILKKGFFLFVVNDGHRATPEKLQRVDCIGEGNTMNERLNIQGIYSTKSRHFGLPEPIVLEFGWS